MTRVQQRTRSSSFRAPVSPALPSLPRSLETFLVLIATRRDRSAGALEGLARHATDSSRSSPASSTTTRTGLPSPYLQALRSSVLAMRSTRARSQTPRAGPPSTVTAHPAWSSSARRRPTISRASLPRSSASGCSSTGAPPARAEASSSDSISDPRRCVWRSAVASWSASAGPDRSRSSRRMRCRSSCSAVSGVRSSCAATVRNSSRDVHESAEGGLAGDEHPLHQRAERRGKHHRLGEQPGDCPLRPCQSHRASIQRGPSARLSAWPAGARQCYSPAVDFVAGTFAEPQRPEGVIEDRSPADVTVLLGRHGWAASQVDRAVDAARAAQPSWAARPPAERTALVRRIGEVLKAREEELARAIALDVGKPLWESRAEVQACVAKAAITVEDGLRLVAPFPAPGQAGAECRFRPLGVLAVLGPFNFPVHLPNGHVLPALACGNAVVFKPSEIAPHAAELYARCLAEAGVPPGVFNLVQGPGPVGAALAVHPGVDGVLFTGSWAVGQAIQRACLGQTKLLALEMGGKNAALVLRDADLDKAIYDAVFSAFVSAGQRCTAASRLIVEGPPARADALAARIAAAAQRLSIGHPLRDGVFMGPLASEAALAKFLAGVSKAAETVLEPRPLSPGGLRGSYVTPGVHRVRERKGSAYEREELFGPDLAVYDAATADEAVAIANATDYGLAASVHTASREAFERCLSGLECGVVNWNAPTVGASGRLPFGGLKRSGNHRPAGLFSTLYCAAPVAILQGEPRLDRARLAPGVSWVDE